MESSNQIPQAQEVSSQMPSPVNNSSKSKVIPVILGFAAAIVIAIVAYFLGTKQSQQPVQTAIQTTPIPSPTEASSKAGDPTANWKTYNDPTSTFTIKYPSGFYETKEKTPGTPDIKGWSFAGHLSTAKNHFAAIGPNGMYFDFYVITRKTGENMKAFVNRIVSERAGEFQPGDVSSDFKKYVNLGGKDSLWYEGSMGPAVIHSDVFIPHDDTHVVTISIWTEEPSKTQQPYSADQKILIDQILSTFKFSDQNQTDLTADWNTYTSTKNNFSIKYPKRINADNENWTYKEFPLGASGEGGINISFGTPSSAQGGYIWGVEIPQNKTVEQAIKEQGQQFSDRKETRKNIIVNGKSALMVAVTTNQVKDWASKNVYIEDKGKVYVIGNGAIEMPEFDSFYNSFRLLN